MFNLLVAGHSEMWETQPYSIGLGRFKEYSGNEAVAIDPARPESLRRLEDVPALLMYEVGAGGPHARVVRHGRIRNIVRRGSELTFAFEPDEHHAYLDRSHVLSVSDQLGMDQFEQHRTHWAVKDGDLPPDLIATGTPERVARLVTAVAAEYTEAKRERSRTAADLEEELAGFPASFEKAMALLPVRIVRNPTPELFPILGIEPRTAEGRRALVAVLQRDAAQRGLPEDWSFSLAWFLSLYGSATERERLDAALVICAQRLIELGGEDDRDGLVEEIGYTLWRCSQSRMLIGRLRREAAVLTDRLIRRQDRAGYWRADAGETRSVRATAYATVALQRLGDDRYHEAIGRAVAWLLTKILPDSHAFPRNEGDPEADLISTVLSLEAIRRSDQAGDVPHVLEAGESWLVSQQTELGGWDAEPWVEDFTVGVVLAYLTNKTQMLAQVDGFLLMARDFFRKAEELQLEGGANNRRLAAIATVHAVEMFLYGLFERREDLALSAFKENGTETLGPREALRALQDALQRIGVITAPQRLPHRDRLSSLVGRRDGIIHRAHEVSEAELSEGMRDARSFIDRFAKLLLNLDLLQ
ncbi:terpene cyclase/mutase family protein [Pseudomonas otitidis]|uniref:prenyltransferase/squalene oxidase repeat-containing protein n=1 Tax=Metapseudomonas otitidis TaxID=319939 RepID=UPI002446963A|nr:terpene cyclase/mutase family protein [Pseudomonas otitidis]MDH1106686.1 terpene cyclase/mutase family protein [Pseudomonas otitidis]MDH1157487.1 terpene cyclase/mutase family protein [Pseudomonas otitidis]MDH1165846.1 terpene cyclase/mutase family protein [Pseudomonas otitidis]